MKELPSETGVDHDRTVRRKRRGGNVVRRIELGAENPSEVFESRLGPTRRNRLGNRIEALVFEALSDRPGATAGDDRGHVPALRDDARGQKDAGKHVPRQYPVQHRAAWRQCAFAIIATLVLSSRGAEPVDAQTPPPWSISVGGQSLAWPDIVQALRLEFGAGGIEPVRKDPKQMPAFAPYAWYAGRDTNGKPIVWMALPPGVKNKLSDTLEAEVRRQRTAAGILFALDAGAGGSTWQRLYHALPDDPAARTAFAGEIIAAVRAASAWTVAKSTADRQWIFANVLAGLSRQQVYALLDARELTATDDSERTTKPPSGLAYVKLAGYFEPGCSFSHTITITFDANDRVYKLDLSPPKPNCL